MNDLAKLKIVVDSSEVSKADAALGKLGKAAGDTEKKITQIGKAAENTNKAIKAMALAAAAVATMAAAIAAVTVGAIAAGVAITKIVDPYNQLQARIKDATRNTGDYLGVSRELARSSKITGTSLEANVSVFQRISSAAQTLGRSNAEALKLSETVQKLGAISGASNEALSAGLLQFGQSMSAGIVRAEEFNSVVENLPAVADALARGLGKTPGELRKMVIEGKLLSSTVFDVLLKQTAEVDQRFAALPPSVARATNSLSISITESLARLDKAIGFSGGVAAAIDSMAQGFDHLNTRGQLLFTGMGDLIRQFLKFTGVLMSMNPLFMGFNDSLGRLFESFGSVDTNMLKIGIFTTQLAQGFDTLSVQIKQTQLDLQQFFETFVNVVASVGNTKGFAKLDDATSSRFDKLRGGLSEGLSERTNKRIKDIIDTTLGGAQALPSTARGTAPPAPGAGDDKGAKALEKFIADLEYAEKSSRALWNVQKQGVQVAKEMEMQLEAENKVRQANLSVSDAEKRKFEDRLKAIEKTIEATQRLKKAQQAVMDASYEASKSAGFLSAFQSGGNPALRAAQDEAAIQDKMRAQFGTDPIKTKAELDKAREYETRIRSEQFTGRALELKQIEAAQEQELMLEKELFALRGQGNSVIEKRKAEIQAEFTVLQAGLTLESEQGRQMKDRLQTITEIRRETEQANRIAETAIDIQNNQDLLAARGQGLSFNKETNELEYMAYDQLIHQQTILNQLKQEGLQIGTVEYAQRQQQLQDLDASEMKLQGLMKRQAETKKLAEDIGGAFRDAFESAISGSESLGQSLKNLASAISAMLIRKGIDKAISFALNAISPAAGAGYNAGNTLQGSVGDFGGGPTVAAKGLALNHGRIHAFASGGLVNSPTLFPMAKGTGLMGEAGPEAIMPLSRMGNGDLGVQMKGMGQGGNMSTISVTNYITVEGGKDKDDNEDPGEKIGKQIKEQIYSLVDDRLVYQKRNGGLLNERTNF